MAESERPTRGSAIVTIESYEHADRVVKEYFGNDMSPAFVYGTLRVGQYNFHRVFEGRTVLVLPNQRVKGYVLVVERADFPYPQALPWREEAEVVGDVVWMDREVWGWIEAMEVRAGYQSEIVRVEDTDGRLAVMYVATPGVDQDLRQAESTRLIAGGDWLAWVKEREVLQGEEDANEENEEVESGDG